MRPPHAHALAVLLAGPAGAETRLRVMSFNIWGGGVNEGKGVEETVAAIRAAGADVVGLQETRAEPADCTAEHCSAAGPSAAPFIDTAAEAGPHPLAVDWPSTRRLAGLGLIDLYRVAHPDPVARPAYTWTPSYDEQADDDHPDRIDFVLGRGEGLRVISAAIVGEDGPRSDIVVVPWLSDHRRVG